MKREIFLKNEKETFSQNLRSTAKAILNEKYNIICFHVKTKQNNIYF